MTCERTWNHLEHTSTIITLIAIILIVLLWVYGKTYKKERLNYLTNPLTYFTNPQRYTEANFHKLHFRSWYSHLSSKYISYRESPLGFIVAINQYNTRQRKSFFHKTIERPYTNSIKRESQWLGKHNLMQYLGLVDVIEPLTAARLCMFVVSFNKRIYSSG